MSSSFYNKNTKMFFFYQKTSCEKQTTSGDVLCVYMNVCMCAK